MPHFITCNAFIGRSYAQVLSGFLRDCVRGGGGMKLDPTEPLYIIELGTGSGKFSFFMLKALLEMKVRKIWYAFALLADLLGCSSVASRFERYGASTLRLARS